MTTRCIHHPLTALTVYTSVLFFYLNFENKPSPTPLYVQRFRGSINNINIRVSISDRLESKSIEHGSAIERGNQLTVIRFDYKNCSKLIVKPRNDSEILLYWKPTKIHSCFDDFYRFSMTKANFKAMSGVNSPSDDYWVFLFLVHVYRQQTRIVFSSPRVFRHGSCARESQSVHEYILPRPCLVLCSYSIWVRELELKQSSHSC